MGNLGGSPNIKDFGKKGWPKVEPKGLRGWKEPEKGFCFLLEGNGLGWKTHFSETRLLRQRRVWDHVEKSWA